jgi:hypothetical protein
LAIARKKNAIERRLDDIAAYWNTFALDRKGRLLRWLTDADGARMVEVFVEAENEEIDDIPDLFIRFAAPFLDPKRHGYALIEILRARYEEVRPGLVEEGVPADWACPDPNPGESDVAAFARACGSLRAYYKDSAENIVAVLEPQAPASPGDWAKWLLALVRSELPTGVRLMVVDDVANPALDALAAAEPERVVTITPDLDMPGAMHELVQEAGGSGPGVAFRKHFVALTTAAASGNLAAAARSADSAHSIAAEHAWPQMQVVVHMAMGGVLLGAGKGAEALARYRAAGQVAAEAGKAGDAVAPKLVVQARFAEGAALLAENRHAEAAPVYEAAAPLAAAQEDHLLAMEGWRMASYCHEVNKQIEPAWRCGNLALDAAEQLDEAIRRGSTLPYAGQGLLRLTKQSRYSREADNVRRRMNALIGPDWESLADAGRTAP